MGRGEFLSRGRKGLYLGGGLEMEIFFFSSKMVL